MQASREWSPPGGTLGEILDETRRRLATIGKVGAGKVGAGAVSAGAPRRPALSEALRGPQVAVIAEVKRRSPSKGLLNDGLNAGLQASAFQAGGACAISVLTEPTYFGGSSDDLRAVRAATSLPVLRKDFHLEEGQLHQALSEGASAVLLIARALPPERLPALMEAARALDLEVVVEVRTEWELERALDAGAGIVGVNSRDLETLDVDERVPARLIPLIPSGVVAVWESGVRDAADMRRAADHGADAVLVGSALSRSKDPAAHLRTLTGVSRLGRHG